MPTKKGHRTAHFSVQIVEDGPGGNITMFFDKYDRPPIIFSPKTGSSGTKAFGNLLSILDEAEPVETQP